jgi:hypothetical protein
MTQTGVVAGGLLTDWVSLGVLASSVPRDVVDDAIAEAGKSAKRARGKLPPHVMVYFVMALALFADDDYEEVAARLTETLRGWGCWEADWEVPTSGGITQARQRLGPEPLAGVFAQVAEPVADLDTIGAFFGAWRLMSVDGMEWDVPDTQANRPGVRVAGRLRRPGRVSEGAGGDGQRVRLACRGAGRDRPGSGREGRRGAVPGPAAAAAAGAGPAAARGPELLLVCAGLLSVLIFPLIALVLLRQGEPTPAPIVDTATAAVQPEPEPHLM